MQGFVLLYISFWINLAVLRAGFQKPEFSKGYIYFQYGTYIANRVHVFPMGYMYFQ